MFENLMYCACYKHRYTLASENLDGRSYDFPSRQLAEREMHSIMGKHGLHIVEVWDDGHYKTYLCNNNVRFHINRL